MRAALSPAAEDDWDEVLQWSEKHFGTKAPERYTELIAQSLRDLESAPAHSGTRTREGLPPGVYTYHLTNSRNNVSGIPVKRPRHFILYRMNGQRIDVLRILHDSRDLARHVPLGYQGDE